MSRTKTETRTTSAPRVPRKAVAAMKRAAAAVLDARMSDANGDEMIRVARPILQEMEEAWMSQFVAEMCGAIRARR